MRVLLINQYFPPDAAATAYLVGELAEDLGRGHSVEVVAGRPSYNPEASAFSPRGVRVRRAWSTTFARGGIGGRLTNYATFVASSIVEGVRGSAPDVVVGFTDPPVIGLVALTVARRFRKPFVYVCEDIFPDVGLALGRLDNPLVVGALRRLNHRLRRDATRIVAIGRDMQEKLVREGKAKFIDWDVAKEQIRRAIFMTSPDPRSSHMQFSLCGLLRAPAQEQRAQE